MAPTGHYLLSVSIATRRNVVRMRIVALMVPREIAGQFSIARYCGGDN